MGQYTQNTVDNLLVIILIINRPYRKTQNKPDQHLKNSKSAHHQIKSHVNVKQLKYGDF